MDTLSAVLSLVRPASYMFRGLAAAGEWAVDFAAQPGILCLALLQGQAWVSVDGEAAHLLRAGECMLLPRDLAVRVGSAVDAPATDAWAVFSTAGAGGVAVLNGGGDMVGIGGFFDFSGRHAKVLLDVLPAIVHIRGESDRSDLRHAIERVMGELRDPQPGSFLVAQHLSHLILLQALRTFMAEARGGGVGWIYALADGQVSAALNAMHADPAHKWTIQGLADCAHMSRSSFAMRFKQLVGEAPIDYLTRWRMLVAADRLLSARDPLPVLAAAAGYASEGAFALAFRRVMGCTPAQYVRISRSTTGAMALRHSA
jgi:AraC-like DNA-binding protein